MRIRPALLLILCVAFAHAELDRNAMCSGAKQCLAIDLPGCSEAEQKPNPDLAYDNTICAPFLNLAMRGLDPKSNIAAQMFSYLGGEYRVSYEIKGRLPVNIQMMDYLMSHMPFTAHLINAYQDTKYNLAYMNNDKRSFYGDNGGGLEGKINWIKSDSLGFYPDHRNIFWGLGIAKVLMWKLYGMALMTLDYDRVDQNQIQYRLNVIVFPANAFLNKVMRMDLFRNVALKKMQEVITNIETAARLYAKGERTQIQKSEAFQTIPWAKVRLQEFEAVVITSGYGKPLPTAPSKLWNPNGAPTGGDSTRPSILQKAP